jgi:CcmD family protein
MRKIRFIPLVIFLLCSVFVNAQMPASPPVEMADGMRSDGKIYVVVGVLVIILIGLFGYLISIDRKISRVEKRIEENKR